MMTRRVALGVFIAAMAFTGLERSAAAVCTFANPVFVTSINHTFPVGSRWNFSLSRATCEGLVIQSVVYKPANGTARQVLASARLSQLHVPYATGTPRFLDITDGAGLGHNASANPMQEEECPGGTRHDGNRVCVQIHDGESHAWRYSGDYRMKSMIVVYMGSQVGDYHYLNRWEFHDDGTIEVKLGLTGQLQNPDGIKSGTDYLPYGGRLNAESQATPIVGIAHWHNAYYRLDFDINGSSNDRVDRVRWIPSTAPSPDGSCTTTGKCGTIQFSPINTETSQTWSPTSATSWFVYDKIGTNADGRNYGYWLTPHPSGLHRGMTGGTETWAGAEMWVTRQRSCELFAVANAIPSLPPTCTPAPPADITAMTNSESVDGQDVVVWYRMSHLHIPRDEDDAPMPTEWMSFEIKPRSFHHTNPAP